MDGLSTAASVIAVLQLTEEVIKICYGYAMTAKDARKDIRALVDELESLQDVLSGIQSLSEKPEAHTSLPTLGTLVQPGSTLTQCSKCLDELKVKLESTQNPGTTNQIKTILGWPFKRKDIFRTIDLIKSYKSTLILAISTDQTNLTLQTLKGVENLKIDSTAAQEAQVRDYIARWLETTNPTKSMINHLAACEKRESTTGEWFLNNPVFSSWKSNSRCLLWLYGIPGCGKTVLMSTIIESLRIQSHDIPALAFFYFDFKDSSKQELSCCISSVIVQIAETNPSTWGEVKKLYKQFKNGSLPPSRAFLKQTLLTMLRQAPGTFILLDGLDECPQYEREKVLKLIEDIMSEEDLPVRLLVSSRKEKDITDVMRSLGAMAISISGQGIAGDINLHIRENLSNDIRLSKFPREVKENIEDVLTKRANGMFRWVHLQLEELKLKRTKPAILEALKSLPKDLEQTYENSLNRIPEELREIAFRALIIIGFIPEPINIDSVAEAALIEPMRHTTFHPDSRLLNPAHDILELLGSFISMTSPWPFNIWPKISPSPSTISERTSQTSFTNMVGEVVVELAHFSVKEFISSRWDNIITSSYPGVFIRPSDHVYGCCVVYLSYLLDQDSRTFNRKEFNEKFPFAYFSQLIPPGNIYHKPSTVMRERLAPRWFNIFTSPGRLQRWDDIRRTKFFISNPITDEKPPISLALNLGLEYIVEFFSRQGRDILDEKENVIDFLKITVESQSKNLQIEPESSISNRTLNPTINIENEVAAEKRRDAVVEWLARHTA